MGLDGVSEKLRGIQACSVTVGLGVGDNQGRLPGEKQCRAGLGGIEEDESLSL